MKKSREFPLLKHLVENVIPRGFLMICLLTTLFVLVDGKSARGQGCAMCQEAARAQASQGRQALNHAIILLLVPPVAIMGGLLVWVFKYRNDPQGSRNGAAHVKEEESKFEVDLSHLMNASQTDQPTMQNLE